jgi:hypothetical protein
VEDPEGEMDLRETVYEEMKMDTTGSLQGHIWYSVTIKPVINGMSINGYLHLSRKKNFSSSHKVE